MDISQIKNKSLKIIADKVLNNIPVGGEDARVMLTTNDILELGTIANYVKRSISGDKIYYSVNMNLNYTNVCELKCPICAFSKDENEEGAYLLSIEEIEKKVKEAILKFNIDEVHIVGGLHPSLKLDYFVEMLRRIKKIKRDIFIVAFTAVEYDYFSKINNLPIEDVFKQLTDAGLGALPGGGAEIFSSAIRNKLTPKKISGERWLEIMEIAHKTGLKTNATMLYNHIEDVADIIDHVKRLRILQDKTGGFKTFVPLQFHEHNSKIKSKIATGYNDIRIYAAARIYLYNIPHIKALWMYLGEKMAQVLLNFGASDIGGTYNYENVVHSAGAETASSGSEESLKRLIINAGYTPVKSTAIYNVIK